MINPLRILLWTTSNPRFIVVLAIRTWAVWQRDRMVGISLALLGTCYIIAWGAFAIHYLQGMSGMLPLVSSTSSNRFIALVAPYPGFRGCLLTASLGDFWLFLNSLVFPIEICMHHLTFKSRIMKLTRILSGLFHNGN